MQALKNNVSLSGQPFINQLIIKNIHNMKEAWSTSSFLTMVKFRWALPIANIFRPFRA